MPNQESNKFCQLWFWGLRKTYPWTLLMILAWRWLDNRGGDRTKTQVRFLATLSKVDAAQLTGFLNDFLF